MSARRRFALLLLPSVIIFNCTPENPTPDGASAPSDNQDRSTFGSFEHRGIIYDISDLMDPQFRANHDDPYVREFDPMVDFRLDGSGSSKTRTWIRTNEWQIRDRVPIPPPQFDPSMLMRPQDAEIQVPKRIPFADQESQQSLQPEP
jgi:hypothetical protein